MIDLSNLTTEERNPRSRHIDELPTLDMLRLINEEDQSVALAVKSILPDIARAVDLIASRLADGGRLFYMGAGTSGRLGILDAAECPPTYGTPPEMVQGILAGGPPAIFRAREGAEDDPSWGERDLREKGFSGGDILVGIAASGRTPYVLGGLKYARSLHAVTIALACTPDPLIGKFSDISLTPVTGPEVVTGSTRMKAGTAQKMVLNMLSTGAMIKLGKVYGNLMVDVKATNEKLEERSRRIVMEATGCNRQESAAALERAGGNSKLAILLQCTDLSPEEGEKALAEAQGRLALALRNC